eukprot:644572-Pleurochrysis_carterae.AAC.4
MRRTSDRPGAISARLAANQPADSSVIACLRVRGSVETAETAKAQPWPRIPAVAGLCRTWRWVTTKAGERSGAVAQVCPQAGAERKLPALGHGSVPVAETAPRCAYVWRRPPVLGQNSQVSAEAAGNVSALQDGAPREL